MTISVIMDTSTYQGRMNHYVFTIKKVWTSHMYPDSILHGETNSGNEVVSDPRYYFHAIKILFMCFAMVSSKLKSLNYSLLLQVIYFVSTLGNSFHTPIIIK